MDIGKVNWILQRALSPGSTASNADTTGADLKVLVDCLTAHVELTPTQQVISRRNIDQWVAVIKVNGTLPPWEIEPNPEP